MIKLKKIDRGKEPEGLQRFDDINIYSLEEFRKLDDLCTVLALTQDLKHVLNTDSCDYYQFKKFNKQDILDMIEDLKELADKMLSEVPTRGIPYLEPVYEKFPKYIKNRIPAYKIKKKVLNKQEIIAEMKRVNYFMNIEFSTKNKIINYYVSLFRKEYSQYRHMWE